MWADLEPERPGEPRPDSTAPTGATAKAQAIYLLIVVALGLLIAATVVSDAP
ncbi:hypothetical protein ACIQCF_26190 [Streptomyces sp. NPDC088353]|uniref:hypothetical protein n=1 Tax=Streptomyces sp. NPDC088353 TaxID=3365855 RepID=UPI003810562E